MTYVIRQHGGRIMQIQKPYVGVLPIYLRQFHLEINGYGVHDGCEIITCQVINLIDHLTAFLNFKLGF